MMNSLKKSMKKIKIRELTRNEKVLLSLLGVVLLGWAAFRFIYQPQMEKLEELAIEKMEYEAKIEDINTTLRKENEIKKEWQELKLRKDRIVATYFPTLDQAQIIYLLNELTSFDDVEIEDMSFSRPVITDFEDFQVESMDISLPYRAGYTGILKMLDAVKDSPRKIAVEQLSMDRTADNLLGGNMNLRIYSLDGIADADKDVIYIDTDSARGKNDPFAGYSEYESLIAEGEGDSSGYEDSYIGETGQDNYVESGTIEDGYIDENGNFVPEREEINPYREEMLADFEHRITHFIPSQELVKGDVSLSTNSKSGKYSLRLEYNIVAIEEENRAFMDLTKSNILFKYPPESIGMWIYSYDYSPVTIGAAFKGQMGEEEFVPLSEGIGWTGWKHVQVSPPTDLSLYPLTLDRLYLEVPDGRDIYGILLIDKLQAIYAKNIDQDGNDASAGDFLFHLVAPGDTLERISQRYYGTINYKNEIRQLNDMKVGDVLPAGKVLVLKKR